MCANRQILSTYRTPNNRYPFCPGCSHALVNDQLNAALVKLQLDPHEVVIVTDIGCVGMSDQYFDVHAFHGLHGRSVTYATGIKLANPKLHVLVLVGDGGTGIGGHHLLNAARRNIGITVLVFNNLNFGMTGGEHSVTTPTGGITATTRGGNLERPLDLCQTVMANGAAYVYRGTAFDKDLPDRMAEAIQTNGFSLLDIWELCTAHYVQNNRTSAADLRRLMQELEFASGVLYTKERPEYAQLYHARAGELQDRAEAPRQLLQKKYDHALKQPVRVVLAGAAGGRVRSAATLLALGGILSGLNATQHDIYPITVMTGYSISEVILSPTDIRYVGIDKPDLLAIVAPEGLSQVKRHLSTMKDDDTVYTRLDLADQFDTRARKVPIDLLRAKPKKNSEALMTVAAMLRRENLYPLEALREAAALGGRAAQAQDNLHTIQASQDL